KAAASPLCTANRHSMRANAMKAAVALRRTGSNVVDVVAAKKLNRIVVFDAAQRRFAQAKDLDHLRKAIELKLKAQEDFARAALERARAICEGDKNPHGTQGTGENEWYTPGEFIESARSVMGSIDLDPATSALAQEVVRATRFFTKDDDGLTKEWCGNV